MKDINSATKVTAIDASDQLLVSDGGTALAKIDYNVLAKAIIEQYTGSSVAGEAQSLKAALDTLNSKLTINGLILLSSAASVKPLTLTVPNTSRHLLILTGPYVSRGHGVYTVSCNASGSVYGVLIGGGDDMPTRVSGTGNTLTITSTAESEALVAVADLVISGNQMTI